MTRVAVDSVLLSKLNGRVLAQVVPVSNGSYRKLPGEPDWDEEDLRRQEQSGKWFTTAEVLEHLKKLEKS